MANVFCNVPYGNHQGLYDPTMAADTREDTIKKTPTPSASSSKENKPDPDAAANATVLATGKDVGVVDVLKTIKLSELKEVHKKPCVRDSLLTGIGGGFGIGGIRAIWGGRWLSTPPCQDLRG